MKKHFENIKFSVGRGESHRIRPLKLLSIRPWDDAPLFAPPEGSFEVGHPTSRRRPKNADRRVRKFERDFGIWTINVLN